MYGPKAIHYCGIVFLKLNFFRISRVVFPLSFSLINAFYWYTYLKHSERIEFGRFVES